MIPIAGSAYTYAYATLGEIFAWMIGWDLILEYAVGSMTVAIGWSGYMQKLLHGFGIELPIWMSRRTRLRARHGDQSSGRAHRAAHHGAPRHRCARVGTRERGHGGHQGRGRAVLHRRRRALRAHRQLGAVPGRTAGRGSWPPRPSSSSRTSASTRSRRRPRRRRIPQRDLPIGIIASLIVCTALYLAVAAVLTGIVPGHRVPFGCRGAARRAMRLSRPRS